MAKPAQAGKPAGIQRTKHRISRQLSRKKPAHSRLRRRLCRQNYFEKLDEKNAKLMLSNSNPKNTNENDDFFEKIYKRFNINEISAKRMINCNSKGRGEISELLITNYEEMNECILENSTLMKIALS